MKSNKAELTVQMLFFIMMGLLMIGIITFGFTKLFFVSETLDEAEFLETKLEIKELFEQCEDPINRGTKFSREFDLGPITTILILPDNYADFTSDEFTSGLSSQLLDELEILSNSSENLVFLSLDYTKTPDPSVANGYTITYQSTQGEILSYSDLDVDMQRFLGNEIFGVYKDPDSSIFQIEFICS